MTNQKTTDTKEKCGFCGKPVKRSGARYCTRCIAHGFHWLHEVTGKTMPKNGHRIAI